MIIYLCGPQLGEYFLSSWIPSQTKVWILYAPHPAVPFQEFNIPTTEKTSINNQLNSIRHNVVQELQNNIKKKGEQYREISPWKT
jgi:hypothetical protein